MTVICVAADSENVTITADRSWTNDFGVKFSRRKLVPIVVEDVQVGAMASCGDARAGSILEEAIMLALHAREAYDDLLGMFQGVLDGVRNELKEWPVEERAQLNEAEMLLIVYGRGFQLDEGWQVMELDWTEGSLALNAIGSGSEIAIGAMWMHVNHDAEARAYNGCLAACELHSECGSPVDQWTMPRAEES